MKRCLQPCAALILVWACGTTRPLRLRVLDEAGKPVPGAVVYLEVVVPGEHPEPADFAFAVADSDGWAPPLDVPAPEIRHPWRSCATIAFLLPGKPYVYPERPPCIAPGKDGPPGAARLPAWSREAGSGLEDLLFPFEGTPGLRARAAASAAAPFRAALREAAKLSRREQGAAVKLLEAIDRLGVDPHKP